MRVFVTGATGYVGGAVAEAFRRRGHRVTGLARSEAKGRALAAREIAPALGDMKDPASYAAAAREADVLVHCAAEYTADYQALDRRTVDAFLALTQGSRTRLVLYTSGVWQYGPTGDGPVDETSAGEGKPLAPWRGEHEKLVLASGGLVIRPGCVYGRSGGLTGEWFAGAEKDGAAPIVGEGGNRWATVHADDCGELFALAAESGLKGELFNATDRSRSTVREMASAASRAAGKNGRLAELDATEAEKRYGGMAQGLALDQHVDSSKALRRLGWIPRFAGFSDDAPRYYAAWMASRHA
ncbi:MAG TPA: NAD-dependent epimerase/dehydratase family protein [Elusimicrobiota bacterium]|nr:NAD-dependent epimerase/dehydratase family protein [Elusimicrobiota bacterium]